MLWVYGCWDLHGPCNYIIIFSRFIKNHVEVSLLNTIRGQNILAGKLDLAFTYHWSQVSHWQKKSDTDTEEDYHLMNEIKLSNYYN